MASLRGARRWLLVGPILAGLGAFSVSASSEVYQCTDAFGNTLYQDSPCPRKPSQPSPAPVRAPTPPTPRRSDVHREEVSRLLLRKAACDAVVPGFREESAGVFNRWRASRRPLIARVESSADYRQALSKLSNQPARPEGRAVPVDETSLCRDSVLGEMEEQVRAVDSRFSSPERTWQTFQRALEGANRDLALSCLTPAARADREPLLRTQPREKLWELAGELSALDFKDDSGPHQTALVPTTGGCERRITFQRLANGEWKIDAL